VKVHAWKADESGCGYFRCELPMDSLRALGHDATANAILPVGSLDELDLIVGQRVCMPGASTTWQSMATDGRALVFEVDDDLTNVHPTNSQPFEFFQAPGVLDRLKANAAVADAVTVTNGHLADVMSVYNPNTFVLPNMIDESMLTVERVRCDRVTVGWTGSASHTLDFDAVAKPLSSFLRRNPEIQLHLMGADYRRTLGRPQGRFTDWNPDPTRHHEAIDFDIAVIPLAYHMFNRSKSDVKFLELSALGIPVVASNYGPYAESIQHGVTGFLVKQDHEWTKYLRALTQDEAMRLEIGGNAKAWAATRTIQRNAHLWEAAYRKVLGT